MFFDFRQFPQVIEQRYMSNKDILFKIKIHQVISEYFEGVYGEQEVIDPNTGEFYKKGKPKEIVLNIEKSKGAQKLDRKIRGQPMQFSNGKYNLRKLNELPFHYCFSGNVDALVENILSNYDWLTSKIRAMSVQHVRMTKTFIILFFDFFLFCSNSSSNRICESLSVACVRVYLTYMVSALSGVFT